LKKKTVFQLNQTLFYAALRVVLGCIFLWASLDKILDPEGFFVIVSNYRILPDALVNPVSLVLPWMEAVCGIMLITGYMVKGSALIVNLLMLIFILALLISSSRGIDISCGCFSISSDKTGDVYMYVIRDIFVFLLSGWVLIHNINAFK